MVNMLERRKLLNVANVKLGTIRKRERHHARLAKLETSNRAQGNPHARLAAMEGINQTREALCASTVRLVAIQGRALPHAVVATLECMRRR
jgi:hypothetical protein